MAPYDGIKTEIRVKTNLIHTKETGWNVGKVRIKSKKRSGINSSRKEKFKIDGKAEKAFIKETLILNKNYFLIIRTNLRECFSLSVVSQKERIRKLKISIRAKRTGKPTTLSRAKELFRTNC